MMRFGHAASGLALLVALSSSAHGQQVQTDYAYDALGRLTKVTRPGTTTTYTYDAAGNRTRVLTATNNNPPPSTAYTIQIPATGPFAYDPRGNHPDPDGDTLTVTEVTPSGAPRGVLNFTATSITYTPNSGQGGQSDSFTYKVSDGKGGIGIGTVTVNIAAATLAPIAQAFTTTLTPNSSGYVTSTSLPLSWSASGGTPTSANVTSAPANGNAVPSGASILYSTNTTWTGQTTLQYTGTNAGGTGAAATGTIKVLPVISSASSLPATAGHQRTVALSSYAVTTNGITSYALPNGGTTAKGSASISGNTLYYTPNAGASGADNLAYTATSPGGTSASANLNFQISCSPPVAGATSMTVAYGSSSNAVPTNISGATATSYNVVSSPAHGYAQPSGGGLYYTPFSTYSGSDSFTYSANGACGTSNTATVTITVQPRPNSSPTVVNTNHNVLQGTTSTLPTMDDDTDPDGDSLTITSVGAMEFVYGSVPQPADLGTVTRYSTYVTYRAPVFYTAGYGQYIVVRFPYTISDGRGGTASGYGAIAVASTPINNPPTAVNDTNSETLERYGSIFVPVLANDSDPDGDSLTIVSLSATETSRAYYSINGNGIDVTAKNVRGQDTITYTISDGNGGTATATLRVYID